MEVRNMDYGYEISLSILISSLFFFKKKIKWLINQVHKSDPKLTWDNEFLLDIRHITTDFEFLLDMISYHNFQGIPKLLDLYGLRSQQAFQQSTVSKCTEQVHYCKILVHWYTKLVY